MAFEPYLAPPAKRDPWWKRLYAHAFLCLLLATLFAGGVFLQQCGVFDRHLARRNIQDTNKSNARIMLYTKIAAVLGASVGAVIAVNSERKKK